MPNDAAAIARFGEFLDARLAELRPAGGEPVASAAVPPAPHAPTALSRAADSAPAAPVAPALGMGAQGETADLTAATSANADAETLVTTDASPPLETIEYADLVAMGPETVARLRRAFVGEAAYGIVGVRGVPSYEAARREACTAPTLTLTLALALALALTLTLTLTPILTLH